MRQRLLLLSLLLTIGATALWAQDNTTQRLVVWLKGGQKVYHDLTDKPETMFSEGMLWLKTDKVSVSYPLTDVLRYTFEGVGTTGIVSPTMRPGEVRFLQGKDAVAFDGLSDGTLLEVYALDGKIVSTVKAQGGQRTVISLANYPLGVYIVKMGDAAFKFVKR